ncbi:MAG: HigA family addiction module antitoxin [Cyanobacteria bacterium P01_F01_bin.42]
MRMEPAHPGALIQEVYIEELGLTAAQLAQALGVSASTVSRILQAKMSISPDMALRLERVLQKRAGVWLAMQMKYDLWHAEQNDPHLELKPLAPVA